MTFLSVTTRYVSAAMIDTETLVYIQHSRSARNYIHGILAKSGITDSHISLHYLPHIQVGFELNNTLHDGRRISFDEGLRNSL
jgi:hypothetical protein